MKRCVACAEDHTEAGPLCASCALADDPPFHDEDEYRNEGA